MTTPSIHPAIDDGVQVGKDDFAGGYLHCQCKTDPVQVTVTSQSAHNHACGCSKCWKPDGALFSLVAVVSRDSVKVTANANSSASRRINQNRRHQQTRSNSAVPECGEAAHP